MSDHFQTLAAPSEFRHKIDRSEFLGLAFPVRAEEDFFAELHRIEKHYFDATHHCWAFRLRHGDDARARSSDAGEPSGTAGKPILVAIDSSELFDVGVVVVRWYGGVKLGTGGLSRAYRETAAEALRSGQRLDRYLYVRFVVTVPFDALGTVYRLISPPDVVLNHETFADTNEFELLVRQSLTDDFRAALTERRLQYVLE